MELLTGFSKRQVRSTTETFGVGTRKAMPVSFLWVGGMRRERSKFISIFHTRKALRHLGGGGVVEKRSPYPFSSGITLPTAFAAPVEAGIMF